MNASLNTEKSPQQNPHRLPKPAMCGHLSSQPRVGPHSPPKLSPLNKVAVMNSTETCNAKILAGTNETPLAHLTALSDHTMEDQFNGRTDDDLFYDDLEPVHNDAEIKSHQEAQETSQAQNQQQSSSASVETSKDPITDNAGTSTSSKVSQPLNPLKATPKPHKSLSSSRFAPKSSANTPAPDPTAPTPEAQLQNQDATSSLPPSGSKQKNSRSQQAVESTTRLQSGANPRTKLTAEELAAKMEEMKVVNAEKTRKFEEAEKDEKDHAVAYARGMEEARQRKAEESERRKRGEENRKKLENEREKNRERKLKAMGMKEGGWDQDKGAEISEESRKSFRGANGGIRGTRRGGLGSSMYTSRDGERHDIDRFLDDKTSGNARSRGGRGRGSRGQGRGTGRGSAHSDASPATRKEPPLSTAEDFPSLPAEGKKETEDSSPKLSAVPSMRSKFANSPSSDPKPSQGTSSPTANQRSGKRTPPQSPSSAEPGDTVQSSKGSYAASLGQKPIPHFPASPGKKWDEEVEEEEEIKRAAINAKAK